MNQGAAEVAWALPGPRLLSDAEVRSAVAAALEHGGRAGLRIAVVFVSDAELARLHGRWLGDPAPTDVMAFDLGRDGGGPEGELYVSAERARTVARERDLSPERELALYVVHGCLHLCGFDDHEPRARARMRAAERAVLARLGHDREECDGTGARPRRVFSRGPGARRSGRSSRRSSAP